MAAECQRFAHAGMVAMIERCEDKRCQLRRGHHGSHYATGTVEIAGRSVKYMDEWGDWEWLLAERYEAEP